MAAVSRLDADLKTRNIGHQTVPGGDPARHAGDGARECRGELVARTVLIADEHGYALAVIPRNRLLDLPALNKEFRRNFRLARPDEAVQLFPGLPPRAMPPIGSDPRVETFLDQSLIGLRDVYFETRTRGRLMRVDADSLCGLFYGVWCGRISRAGS